MAYHAARHAGAPGAPLLITFHGTGGDEHQFHRFGQELLPGAHVVSPRGDVSEAGALRYFRRKGEGVYDMEDLAERRTAMIRFVEGEISRSGAERVIGLGYSNGANILAAMAMMRPDLFTDLALLHPLIPWRPEPQPGLSGRRVLVTAGERDPICPAPQTTELIDWFEMQGMEVTTAWHPGGHEVRPAEIEALRAFLAGGPA
ncbi:alpha/beta hydrolase [Limimaricola pyoseonensis]|uniref:Phospholipase/carboxylesterase n=1 Tax=Limimaricola pyoseonensis TaxID=521013 RepID=A0A1G7E5I9_9RHOB|nr:alpha/beta hydrolase [Limimaricola pyoseonensis]SDE58998.1 phospholipase/carboxylesterase [Limimaricola pyoseonensis]